jgi:Protein of unknown function (DUF3224)
MNRHRAIVLALLVPLFALLAPPSADAGTRISATGEFTQTSFTVTGSHQAGPLTFLSFQETDALTGTLSGTSLIIGECIVFPTGEGKCKATETFTGTVDGKSGTLVFHDVINLDNNVGSVDGRFQIVRGTGELSGVHGQGTFSGVAGTGSYAASLTFAG